MTARFDPIRIWINKWGRIVFGTWLMIVSVVLVVVAFMAYATQGRQEQLGLNIQTERAEGYRLNCYDQNGRNRKGREVLRSLTDDPQAIKRTMLLIDAIVPVKDCDDLAKSRVRAR